MADQVVEEEVTETGEETVETPAQEKVLTQTEVNKILARERSSLNTRHKNEMEAKDELLRGLEEIVQGQVETMSKDLPKSIQAVLKKLPLMEQYEALKSDDLQISKKTIPSTESAEPKQKPEEAIKEDAFQRFKKS